MSFGRVIIFLGIAALVVAGGYAYTLHIQSGKRASIRQMCLQKYKSMPQSNVITDIDGFCECSANIKRPATPEEVRAGGKACMDLYGKQNLLKMCEDLRKNLQNDETAKVKGLNCECFYEMLLNLFSDEMISQNGAGDLDKQKRDQVVIRAFSACSVEK